MAESEEYDGHAEKNEVFRGNEIHAVSFRGLKTIVPQKSNERVECFLCMSQFQKSELLTGSERIIEI
jgi:hypothetical protein